MNTNDTPLPWKALFEVRVDVKLKFWKIAWEV
jgi:hypothetical protein